MFSKLLIFGVMFFSCIGIVNAEQKIPKEKINIVIKDTGINVSENELRFSIKHWPEKSRREAVTQPGTRQQLLTQFIMNRKIAEEVKNITEETDPDFYWQREFAIRNLQNKLFLERFKKNLKIPDMTELAKEKLLVNREKFSALPEQRKASHILVKCSPKDCNRDDKRPLAEKIHKELLNGANFEEMVKQYSEDPGSLLRNGQVRGWLILGQPRVDPYFVEGVYSIKNIGEYSNLVETKFGFHIIRLDDIKQKSFKPDEKVLPQIIEALEARYRSLAEQAFMSKLVFSEDAFIDDKAIAGLLEPYRAKDIKTGPKKSTVTIKKIIRD